MRPLLSALFTNVRGRLVLVVLLLVSSVPAFAQHGEGGPPAAAAAFTAEQLRADITAFRANFMARDKSFSTEARADAGRRLAALEAEGDKLTLVRVDLVLSQVAALADNGHTHVAPGGLALRHNRVALRVTPFGEEFHVLRATDATAELLGARLVAIDGRGIAELRSAARTLSGGTAAWRDRMANVLLESPELLHAMGLATASDAATYSFVLLDGRRVGRRLVGEVGRADSPVASAGRWLLPVPMKAEGAAWRALLPAAEAPWALQEPGVPFRFRRASEINGFVVELRQTSDAPERSVRDFLSAMTDTITRMKPVNVVVDMRLNGGGDLNKARDFMKSLPALVSGRVYVLTSPWTFSAAISSVGYLKQAAPDRVTIVGEEVGDRLVFFAEGSGTALPNTGARFGLATERHDYQGGCRAFADCHGPVVRNPIAVPSLAPDLVAPWTIEAYVKGRDPGMDAVVAAMVRP